MQDRLNQWVDKIEERVNDIDRGFRTQIKKIMANQLPHEKQMSKVDLITDSCHCIS